MIDISVTLAEGMPVWPGSIGIRVSRTLSLERGDVANVSRLDCDVHVGTHVDAPRHFITNGTTVEQMPLDVLVGPAQLVDLRDVDVITAGVLDQANIKPDATRVLFRTRNSEHWANMSPDFDPDFVALDADAARWVVDHGIRLVGVDYLSVQRYTDSPETHEVLLAADVVIVEGLNLVGVESGLYELLCLPVKLGGAEGAPARAVLRPLE